MATIVIGGHSRSVGKTSVVAGLIAALPGHDWTAFKITQYGHGICSRDGSPCDCVCADHSWAISEERDRSGASDSSRFLAAGAARSWWVRTEQGRLGEAMPLLQEKIAAASHAIIESNSVLEFLRPDLYLSVLDPATSDFKKSAQRYLARADALVVHTTNGSPLQWQGVSLPAGDRQPAFLIQPPRYVTAAMIEFVKAAIEAKAR